MKILESIAIGGAIFAIMSLSIMLLFVIGFTAIHNYIDGGYFIQCMIAVIATISVTLSIEHYNLGKK